MASGAEVVSAGSREERGKSVGRRLLSRMKTVLRRNDASKQSKRSSLQFTTHALFPPPPDTVVPTATAASGSLRILPIPAETNVASSEVDDHAAIDGVVKIPRSQVYNDHFQKLYKNSGLSIDPSSFYHMEGHVLRVNKNPRVRVHRICHQCGSRFDKTGLCEKCNHNFCRQCTRHPPKRTETERSAQRETKAEILKDRAANHLIWPDPNFDPEAPVVVTRPARPEQQLVFKKVRQRVRRTCCQCLDASGSEIIFLGGRRDCAKCAHVRCTDCPRDPPKKDKYPYGYPGDAFGIHTIPHYRCHQCHNKFPPGVENGTSCAKCSHEKCDHCARLKPQKVEPGPDAELVKRMQKKLAAMSAS